MPRARILVVDDEPGMLEVCSDVLSKLPEADVETERDSRRAAERLATERFDLLITDIRMPGMTGVELLRAAREHDPDLPALMLTAFPTVETAVESMKLGAADYLTKPFNPVDLRTRVRHLLEERRLHRENRLLGRQLDRGHWFDGIIGKSEVMRNMFETIRRVAAADVDVLIVGDTGVGKELVARSIHKESARREGRFVPVDCGAISESLLESEFFGHERGAFTGADRRTMGLIEFAEGGSCFLDEIANLPAPLQTKLLRVIQERTYRRVGGTEEIPANVRIIAATNRDLEVEVREGRFAEDLYYRINVARIEIPPLRERREDIPLLIDYYVERFAREMGKGEIGADPEFTELLTHHRWPGNVRELQNTIKRALLMTRGGKLTPDDLADDVVIRADRGPSAEAEGFFQLREQRVALFEREYLSQILRACRGDVTAAAGEARVPRGTMYRLMKKHDLDAADFRPPPHSGGVSH